MNKFSNKTIMIINLMKIITVSDEAWNASVLFWHTNWNVIWHTESNDYVSWDFFHVFECKNGCPKELDFKNNWGPEYTGEFFASKKKYQKQWKFCKWSNNLFHSVSFLLAKKLVNKLTDFKDGMQPNLDFRDNLVRDHSSIMSSKTGLIKEVGGVKKWQFLMIYRTVNHQSGWVGLKKSKTWWCNTWMVPYINDGLACHIQPYR